MEPKNRSRTDSPADHLHLDNSACITTGPAESDSPSKPLTVTNADNAELQPYVDGDGHLIGDIDEVNALEQPKCRLH